MPVYVFKFVSLHVFTSACFALVMQIYTVHVFLHVDLHETEHNFEQHAMQPWRVAFASV
jgi:hypothetical protein